MHRDGTVFRKPANGLPRYCRFDDSRCSTMDAVYAQKLILGFPSPENCRTLMSTPSFLEVHYALQMMVNLNAARYVGTNDTRRRGRKHRGLGFEIRSAKSGRYLQHIGHFHNRRNMSGDFPFSAKIVSPVRCNEKPWDLWVSEIGHTSPKRDDESPGGPTGAELKGARRSHDGHPYKAVDRVHPRYRRSGLNRLKFEVMNLHELFPQMDNLNAAVCHMCGVVVKCSAVYRHLQESHGAGVDPILPPPPPAPTVKLKTVHSRGRHKKELIPPPPPIDVPVPMETSPAHSSSAPISRIVLPHSELQYLDEASTSTGVTGEVQVCVESGELPVVSIQDTDELPLDENITDDIFAIMKYEGIQSADDITNAADWKNIIRDIGNMQDINFSQPVSVQSQELQTPVDTSLSTYTLTDADISSLQFASSSSPMLSTVIDNNILSAQGLKPATGTPTKVQSKTKSSKSKFSAREYDPNKHCGVVTAENPKPCTRSLTCKAHTLSLRRTVEGRSKPFDTLLAEHRASRDATLANATAVSGIPAPPAAPPHASTAPLPIPPSILVNTPLDLAAFNGLATDAQVNDIYASLLGVDDPNATLPDTTSITSLLPQTLPTDPFLLPDDADLGADVPIISIASPPPQPPPPPLPTTPVYVSVQHPDDKSDEGIPQPVTADVSWYTSCPRPLALCTYNASHAGGAITLGKRFATVRSNIKSSLSRSQTKMGGTATLNALGGYYGFGQNSLSLSKSVHVNNTNKPSKPEVRRLIVNCAATAGRRDMLHVELPDQAHTHALNGHVDSGMGSGPCADTDLGARRKRALKVGKRSSQLDLAFTLDSLLADEKC
ncbi:Ataxin-7-like protein 1 [Eumeta japonica]|uniref:Ataxin-7-like protein 1 n=1 Tax=Eumeta variegata TaxID=151549 RepID=A0A4C1W3E4_EUMVA|nr:Ataxin-7-like protein 1 [Eumeta japonica]